MNELNEKYWDLIEKGNFDELNKSEQNFILENFSREDFEFNRKINSAAQSDELVLASQNRDSIMSLVEKRPKHQYKYAIGFVAGILIMFGLYTFFFQKSFSAMSAEKICLTDTIYQKQLVQDTVYLTQNPDTIYQKVFIERQENSMPDVVVSQQSQIGLPTTEIHTVNQEDIVNKGIPIDDREFSLVHDFTGTSRFQ